MDIDLSKVIGYSRDSLQSRTLMRAIILDLYPGKTREMNVLLDVYESGVPRKIKNDGNITDAQYAQYIQIIVDEYGMQEQWAVVGLNEWIDVCLGNGKAAALKYKVVTPTSNGNSSNVNASGGYTNPIVHNDLNNNYPITVKGNPSDYQLKDLGNGCSELVKFNGFDVEDTLVPNVINGCRIIGIGENAYKSCLGIKRLIIPEGIEYIKDGAFDGCSELIEATLPTTLKQMGTEADGWGTGVFSSTKIQSINLPNSITAIGHNTFSYCYELEFVQLPDNLEVIGSHAFYKCKNLKKITFPNSVKRIHNSAFEDCVSLSNIRLNEGLKEIDKEAFKGCGSILKITLPSTIISFGNDIFKFGYSTSKVVAKCYPGSKAIEYCRINRIAIENAGT